MKSLPKISEYMDAVVPTLSPETQIMKAVDFLLRHRVTGAPVVDPDGKLLGIITETDLLKLVTEGIQAQPPYGGNGGRVHDHQRSDRASNGRHLLCRWHIPE